MPTESENAEGQNVIRRCIRPRLGRLRLMSFPLEFMFDRVGWDRIILAFWKSEDLA